MRKPGSRTAGSPSLYRLWKACTHGRPEFDPSGRPLRLFGIVRDITARKRAEENMHRTLTDREGLLLAMGCATNR